MEHLDAKAIRERLHVIMLAITTLEGTATPAQVDAIASARSALQEVALLVTGDEAEEHGQEPPLRLRQTRDHIRRTETSPGVAASAGRRGRPRAGLPATAPPPGGACGPDGGSKGWLAAVTRAQHALPARPGAPANGGAGAGIRCNEAISAPGASCMATPEAERYLLHLNHALSMESALVDHLEQRAAALDSPNIRQRLQDHRTETMDHRETLKRIIRALGGQPTTAKASVQPPITAGVLGTVRNAIEADKADQAISKALADYAVESFEAGVYLALAEMARKLGHSEHVADFDRIRQEEEEMAQFLASCTPQVVGAAFLAGGQKAA